MQEFKYFIFFIFILVSADKLQADNTYFDLSETNIKIQTDFVGKEIIIFGILDEEKDTILTIKGPIKNSKILIGSLRSKYGIDFKKKLIKF